MIPPFIEYHKTKQFATIYYGIVANCNDRYIYRNKFSIIMVSYFILNKKEVAYSSSFDYINGRGNRTRTRTDGFGDRYATIDTIPLRKR
jgi:hypothetical protein